MKRYHIFKLGLAVLFYATYCIRPRLVNGLERNTVDESISNGTRTRSEDPVFYQGMEGTPGIDFPILSHIPRTTFSCKGIESGYYADLETDCQVFHICEEERKISFLCPNGTIFQQSELICEWWFKVNCTDAPQLYGESAEQLRDDIARRKASRRVYPDDNDKRHGAVMRTEESLSISARQNGRTLPVSKKSDSSNGIPNARPAPFSRKSDTQPNTISTQSGNRAINFVSIDSSSRQQTSKTRRYNDAQTGNYLNDIGTATERYLTSKTHKEYHVQFASTNNDSTTAIPYRQYSNHRDARHQHDQNGFTATPKSEPASKSTRNFGYYNTQYQNSNGFTSRTNLNSNYESVQTVPNSNNYSSSSYRNSIRTSVTYSKSTAPVGSTTNRGTVKYDVQNNRKVTQPDYAQTVSDFTLALSNNVDQNSRNYNSQPADSDEAQITQESSSFIKSSFNTIKDDEKYSTPNPHPNHRTTYSDLKQPTFSPTSTKFVSISSVTPQYITTQPINNGKPFLGSRVGASIQPQVSSSTTAQPTTTKSITANTYVAEENKELAKVLLNTVKVATIQPPVSTTPNANKGTVPVEKVTPRTVDYATVYGTFSGTKPTPSPFRQNPNGVQIKFGKNSDKVSLVLGKSLTGAGHQNQYDRYEAKATSERPRHTYLPLVDGSTERDKIPVKVQSGFGYIPITFSNTSNKYSSPIQPPLLNANVKVNDVQRVKADVAGNGFYVTKQTLYNSTTWPLQTTTLRPKPFEKPQRYSIIPLSTSDDFPSATVPTYRISSARPFELYRENEVTPGPTSSSTSIYENVDNMINALVKFADAHDTDYSSETPRPGLNVPPSAGPQTLHTLAVYFANALDSVIKDKEKLTQEEMIEKKEELTTLLTEMTVHGYNQLFKRSNSSDDVTTTPSEELDVESSSNGLADAPQIRLLARNFSIALASYLNDPEMFRKDLAELRPTEPPFYEEDPTEKPADNDESPTDEELLNYSDADGKSSFPPLPSPSPTWGFILATKSNDLDVKNSLGNDLNTADSQSLIPSYNNLDVDNKRPTRLPDGHWTTSPTVTKLWTDTFGVNPVVVNEQFETTVAPLTAEGDTEEFSSTEKLPTLDQPQREIQYELRTLPKISLNSTQIHGILIDFVNTSSSDSSRLHRLLKKLNTTEAEFLNKMKEIEANPLTRRLILLLISECGKKEESSEELSKENLKVSATSYGSDLKNDTNFRANSSNSPIPDYVNEHLNEEDQDVRALQLLNALYGIASRFGK